MFRATDRPRFINIKLQPHAFSSKARRVGSVVFSVLDKNLSSLRQDEGN